MFSLPCLLTTRFLFALIRISIVIDCDEGHHDDDVDEDVDDDNDDVDGDNDDNDDVGRW